jgi:hypothetical protein
MRPSSLMRTNRLALGIALTLATLGARAELVTATATGQPWTLNGQAALTYQASKDTVRLLNVTDAKASSQDASITLAYRVMPGPSPILTSFAVGGLGVQSVTLETRDRSLHGLQLSGSFTVKQETDNFTSSADGSLTVSNLQIDLDQKKVFATFTGTHGVGTIERLSLFDIGTASAAPVNLAPPPLSAGSGFGWYGYGGAQTTTPTFGQQVLLDSLSVQLGSLSLTQEGAKAWSQALAYTPIGNTALASVQDWGTLGTPAVPEPGTWALMGLGLVGIAGLKRRTHTQRATATMAA